MKTHNNRCDRIISLIDACLADVEACARPVPASVHLATVPRSDSR
jgi:hypothetical protein